MESAHQHLKDGKRKCQEAKDYPTHKKLRTAPLKIIHKRKRSTSTTIQAAVASTPESPLHTRNKPCKDTLKNSTPNIQNTTSYPISAPVSSSAHHNLKPYWNEFTKERSKTLWSPTEIEFVNTNSNGSNSSCNKRIRSSWFTTKESRSKFNTMKDKNSMSNSLLCSWQEIIDVSQQQIEEKDKKDKENFIQKQTKHNKSQNQKLERNAQKKKTSEKEVETTKSGPNSQKIEKKKKNKNKPTQEEEEEQAIPVKANANSVIKKRLYFNKHQEKQLMKAFGAYRWTYN